MSQFSTIRPREDLNAKDDSINENFINKTFNTQKPNN